MEKQTQVFDVYSVLHEPMGKVEIGIICSLAYYDVTVFNIR